MVHAASLQRVARRMTGDQTSAEDAVQEALLSAWRTFDHFQDGTNCRAWLFKILLNHLRKNFTRPSLEIVDIPETLTLDNVVPIRSRYDGFSGSDITAAIDTLPAERRVVLLLAAVEGFTCKEIAGFLDVPIGTVMSRLSRARSDLRQLLYPQAATVVAPKKGNA